MCQLCRFGRAEIILYFDIKYDAFRARVASVRMGRLISFRAFDAADRGWIIRGILVGYFGGRYSRPKCILL